MEGHSRRAADSLGTGGSEPAPRARAREGRDGARLRGFPPLATPMAQALVLGTMPSRESLRAGRYYAHPRNAFWRVLGEVLGFDGEGPYEARVAALAGARVAVWDVLRSCRRAGSLDADIEAGSVVPNDFEAFFAKHPRIRRIVFNGAKAQALYARNVEPALPASVRRPWVRLPSTSPAHAALSPADKVRAWRALASPQG